MEAIKTEASRVGIETFAWVAAHAAYTVALNSPAGRQLLGHVLRAVRIVAGF